MRRLRFSPAARRDLERIAAYLIDVAGATIARQVVERIRAACRLVAETPGAIGTPRPEIRPGIRSFPVPPFVLFLRFSDGETDIVRILHERQVLDEGRFREEE